MKRILALILALLTLPACAPAAEETADESGPGLWFAVSQTGDHSDSAAVAREERVWAETPTARTLMETLLRGPVSDGLRSPFPRGVSVRSVELQEEGRVVLVDLSEQYGGLAGIDLTIADYCIALTLCQLPGVEMVKVTVEGESIPYRDRQALREGDVLLSGIAEEPEAFLATLYFPDRGGLSLDAEYRQVVRGEAGSEAWAVLEELLRGPLDREDCQSLPEGARLLDVTVADGVCQVDLSAEFLDNAPQSEDQAGLVLSALSDTLCALNGINRVRLLVEGESLSMYGGVIIDEYLQTGDSVSRTH